MVIATLFISLAALIVIGAPIAVCIGFAPIAALVAAMGAKPMQTAIGAPITMSTASEINNVAITT